MKKDAPALFRLASTALKRAGANDRMAEAAARHLVRADGAAEKAAKNGIEIPDELVAQIEKLCST